jgi:hemerythrin superfamily protein
MLHVIEKLQRDHEKVEKLLDKLMDSGDGAQKTRADLARQVRLELEAHTAFEEEVFYPAVRSAGDGADTEVSEAIDEHNEVKEMLERLKETDPEAEDFLDLIGSIREAVQEHVQHEEEDIFPLAQRGIEEDSANDMARRHDRMAQDYMQHAGR